MEIIDIIDRVKDKRQQHRDHEKIEGIMVHRCGVNLKMDIVLGYDGPTIADVFCGRVPKWQEVADATGGQNAYTFYVGGSLGPEEYDGQIWQALPLDEIGWHGSRFSRGYLGISVIGDPRVQTPSTLQMASLSSLIGLLCLALGLGVGRVKGHGEVQGGKKAPGKPAACPGDLLSIEKLRSRAAGLIATGTAEYARRRLIQYGMVFPDGQ